jgi:hypothetical protein
MDTLVETVFMQLPALLVVGAVVTSLAWWQHEGAVFRMFGSRPGAGLRVLAVLALAAVWLVLTVVSWWWLLAWAYLTVVSMYFLLGVFGGWAALACAGALFLVAPLFWGAILFGLARREFRYASARPPVRGLTHVRALPH